MFHNLIFQMIFFPEACDYICDSKKDIVAFSEPILGGDIVGKYRQLAAKHNVWLSMGGVHEKVCLFRTLIILLTW